MKKLLAFFALVATFACYVPVVVVEAAVVPPRGELACETYGVAPGSTGTINTAQFNRCIAASSHPTLRGCGTYTIAAPTAILTSDSTNTYHRALVIPSNTDLELSNCVTLKLAAGITNPVIIQNSDITNGNTNITVRGGTWDGNGSSQTLSDAAHGGGSGTNCAIMRWFQNVTNISVHDSIVTNPVFWADGFAANTVAWVYNLRYIDTVVNRTTADNFGGVNLEGPNNNYWIANIHGNILDDLVAVVTDQSTHSSSIYIHQMAGYGPANNIHIEGVYSDPTTGVWNHVRLLDSVANPITNATVFGVYGPYISTSLRIGSDTISGNTSKLQNIEVSNVNVSQFPAVLTNPTVMISGSAQSLTVRSVKRSDPAAVTTPGPLVQVVTTGTTPAVGTLTLDDLYLNTSATGAGANMVHVATASITVDQLNISNLTYYSGISTTGSGNALFIVPSATVTDIHASSWRLKQVQRAIAIDGITSTVDVRGLVFVPGTAITAEAIRLRGTIPIFSISNSVIDLSATNSNAGVSSGIFNLNGSTGTTFIESSDNVFKNAANPVVKQTASEAVRWVGDASAAVDVGILTPSAGDTALNANTTAPGSGMVTYNGATWNRLGQVVKRATTDQTLSGATTGSTLTNLTNMNFAIGASEEWLAVFDLDVGAALATTGVKFAVTGPTSSAPSLNCDLTPDVVVLAGVYDKRTTTSATALDFTTTQLASAGIGKVQCMLNVVNSSTAGTINLQGAQSTSSATGVLIKQGSAMRAQRVQ